MEGGGKTEEERDKGRRKGTEGEIMVVLWPRTLLPFSGPLSPSLF